MDFAAGQLVRASALHGHQSKRSRCRPPRQGGSPLGEDVLERRIPVARRPLRFGRFRGPRRRPRGRAWQDITRGCDLRLRAAIAACVLATPPFLAKSSTSLQTGTSFAEIQIDRPKSYVAQR
jgi:hypothetical protein